jgi:amidase
MDGYRMLRAPALAATLLIVTACAGAPSRTAATQPAPDWHAMEVADLQAAMAQGALDAETLVRHLLARIAALDDAGPRLDAVVETNPDALAIARARDAERKTGTVRGPLHGIPVLLKDNIDSDDAMATTAGSLALAGHHPGRDATLVARLRDAGAVILGKTNLSEWANFRSRHSTSGWSARGGQTRNPYVLDRNPCGSSSGSAVAVAAGFAPLAVGTETDGSIVCPAAVNGVVGLKPTLGAVSRHGVIPIAHSQDTAGPIARSVQDAALLLQAMSGQDPADAATGGQPEDFAAALAPMAPRSLAGLRLGVLRRHFGQHPGVDAALEPVLARLSTAGATLVDVELPTHGQFGDDELQVLLFEFHHDLDAYLADTKAPVGSLEALIAWNRAHAGTELRWFGQDIFEQAVETGPLTDPAYLAARKRARRLAGPEGIAALLRAHDLDALLAPTTGPAWPTDLVNGDHYGFGSSSAAAVAGYPNVTIPAGQVHGLPVGLSLMGAPWSDAQLLALAASVMSMGPGFQPPTFVPTVGRHYCADAHCGEPASAQ